jgi:glycerophosphoryl diester phosphodiesterase
VAGRYAIECDLHISADGVPVIFHDSDLRRLTGRNGCVRDLSAAALGGLRLAGTPEWIPTLAELLRLVEGRVPLLLEMKHMPGRDAGLSLAVVEQLRRYAGPAAVMSFAPGLVAEVRNTDPSIVRGLLGAGRGWAGIGAVRIALRVGAHFLSYCVDDLPTPAPILAHRLLGLPLVCWTVANPAQRAVAERWTDQYTFEGFAP